MTAARSAAAAVEAAIDDVRRALSPVEPPIPDERRQGDGLAPADPVRPPTAPPRQPVPLPPGVFDDDLDAASHLVAVPGIVLIVDGYNVTKAAHPELSLAEQRAWMASVVMALTARTTVDVELVFDGADGGSAPADLPRRVRVQVRFSSEGVEADDLVLDRAAVHLRTRPVLVVSSDRRVQVGARRLGANVIDSGQLVHVLR